MFRYRQRIRFPIYFVLAVVSVPFSVHPVENKGLTQPKMKNLDKGETRKRNIILVVMKLDSLSSFYQVTGGLWDPYKLYWPLFLAQ